eukprot:COSAG02_NODE_3401_length_6805_cov_70.980763_2_plen_210_part_00
MPHESSEGSAVWQTWSRLTCDSASRHPLGPLTACAGASSAPVRSDSSYSSYRSLCVVVAEWQNCTIESESVRCALFEGGISSDWAKTLRDVPGAELEAVAARSLSSATEFAEEHGVRTALESYTELVQSDTVDIVYIGTITSLHKEHATMAIAAGKSVLCEKPLAESVTDAEESVPPTSRVARHARSSARGRPGRVVARARVSTFSVKH